MKMTMIEQLRDIPAGKRGGQVKGSLKLFFAAVGAVLILLLGGCGRGGNDPTYTVSGKYLYVNNHSRPTNYVTGFAINADGTLTPLAGSPFATGGSALGISFVAANRIAMARDKKLLFVSNTFDSTITVFAVNTSTGALTTLGAPVASGGAMWSSGSLAVNTNETYLFVANAGPPASISVFTISASGSLAAIAGSPFPVGNAEGVTLNTVGNRLYVASNGITIEVLSVAANGALTPIMGSPFSNSGGIVVDSIALVSSTIGLSAGYSGSGTLASYSLDATGVPSLLHTLTVGGAQNCVTTTHDGQLAIVSGGNMVNRISVLQLASDGTLTPVNASPFATAVTTTGCAVAAPNGSYLYATEVGQIEAFSISSTGSLTTIRTYPVSSDLPSAVIY